jgi:hypothetical protein
MGLYTGNLAAYYSEPSLEKQGSYQFISITDIINNFRVAYVGEDKIIPKISRADIKFHAMRGVQELTYDTFRSCKSLELEVPPNLLLPIPHDYVNYTKITWLDSNGHCHTIHQCKACPKDALSYRQDGDGKIITKGSGKEIITEDGRRLVTKSFQVEKVAGYHQDTEEIDYSVDPWFEEGNPDVPIYSYITEWVPAVFQTVTISVWVDAQGNFIEYESAEMGSGSGLSISDVLGSAGGQTLYGPRSVGTSSSNLDEDGGYWSWHLMDQKYVYVPSGNTNAGGIKIIKGGGPTPTGQGEVGPYIEPSTTWASLSGGSSSTSDSEDKTLLGARYGLDPQHANANGCFWINCRTGKIHFDSKLAGKTVIIQYISDGLGSGDEMIVHKFAEEAMYKHIAHSILNVRSGVDRNIVAAFKKERFAAVRNAKIRLSSIKLEEITQIMRGKSKWIKH